MGEFILERYNYWMIIILMMIGLYITFQSGNMIKRLVGLSIFQTSVFLFYVTLSKVAGGTAPILFGKDGKADYGDKSAYGGSGEKVFVDHVYVPGPETIVTPRPDDDLPSPETLPITEDQPEIDPAALAEGVEGGLEEGAVPTEAAPVEGGELAPVEGAEVGDVVEPAAPAMELGDGAVDVARTTLENVYSNPLPHVLILTAIVVGVATLSVGLALVVRIREAYGTIESDEVREADIANGLADGEVSA